MSQEAEDLMSEALALKIEAMSLSINRPDLFFKAIEKFEAAINLGLLHELEMQARFFLGECYFRITDTSLPEYEYLTSTAFTHAVFQMETTAKMDAEGGYGFLVRMRSRLQAFDVSYTTMGRYIAEVSGTEAAIQYYSQKLELFSYLPSQPLIILLLDLGVMYGKAGEDELAQRCFLLVRNAEPVVTEDPHGIETETRVRQFAEDNLAISNPEELVQSNQSKCFIATAVYGKEAPELVIFRNFRDEILLKQFAGQLFVKLYYKCSPSIAGILDRSDFMKRFVKAFVLQPILTIIENLMLGRALNRNADYVAIWKK